VPGRLSLEVMWSPASQQKTTTQGGSLLTTRFSSATYFGARYERLLTSTQGFYFGATPLFRRARQPSGGLAPDGTALGPSQWGYDGLWYSAGYIFELPFQHKGNMTHHVGVTFNGEGGVRMEWRVSLGTLRRRGRDSFGIRSTDPNPYQQARPRPSPAESGSRVGAAFRSPTGTPCPYCCKSVQPVRSSPTKPG